MNMLKNFVNQSLCEYQSIFPNVLSVLDHLFFVIGNGYEIEPESGMFAERGYDEDSDETTYKLLSDCPKLDNAGWLELILKCHKKEAEFVERAREMQADFDFLPRRHLDAEYKERCARYKAVDVFDSWFSEEDLYHQLREMNISKPSENLSVRRTPRFLRPYPLSTDYSDIYNLNENTPAWLVQIAINLVKAWVKFLNSEIKYDHVYKEAPTPLKGEQFIGSGDDYSNMEWTTRHRDMLVDLLPKLQALHDSHYDFKPRDKVVVKERDPMWTYHGVAEPKPGMKGTILKIRKEWKDDAVGKVAVSFPETELGYEKSDKGNITIFVNPAILGRR